VKFVIFAVGTCPPLYSSSKDHLVMWHFDALMSSKPLSHLLGSLDSITRGEKKSDDLASLSRGWSHNLV